MSSKNNIIYISKKQKSHIKIIMAKKKQRKKIYKIPVPKLEKTFNCPECGHKKVVEVRFNKKEGKGYLRCRSCGDEYEGKLKKASSPIDIYYEWIDYRDNEKEKEYQNKVNDEQENEEGGEQENYAGGDNEDEGDGEGDNNYEEEENEEQHKNKYKEDDDEDY